MQEEKLLAAAMRRRRRRSLLVVQESTEIPILLSSWSNRFPWKGVTRVTSPPITYVPVCAPANFHEFADQLKGTRFESDGSTVLRDEAMVERNPPFVPRQPVTACTTFFLRLEHASNTSAKAGSTGEELI